MITQKRNGIIRKLNPKKRKKKRNKGTQNRWDKQKNKMKDVDIKIFISVITLKANDLNTLIKRHRLYAFSYILRILVNF